MFPGMAPGKRHEKFFTPAGTGLKPRSAQCSVPPACFPCQGHDLIDRFATGG